MFQTWLFHMHPSPNILVNYTCSYLPFLLDFLGFYWKRGYNPSILRNALNSHNLSCESFSIPLSQTLAQAHKRRCGMLGSCPYTCSFYVYRCLYNHLYIAVYTQLLCIYLHLVFLTYRLCVIAFLRRFNRPISTPSILVWPTETQCWHISSCGRLQFIRHSSFNCMSTV